MKEKSENEELEQVECEVCLKEIPVSEARSEEASGYVAHFCGLDCYDKWRKQQEPTDK